MSFYIFFSQGHEGKESLSSHNILPVIKCEPSLTVNSLVCYAVCDLSSSRSEVFFVERERERKMMWLSDHLVLTAVKCSKLNTVCLLCRDSELMGSGLHTHSLFFKQRVTRAM